ncbi:MULTISPECIES: glycosyltransferase family 8 protein [unclassified Gilliamella]|uniref:glycosyltransferase family 8 protein n=1 Tax=unclassified Gilliamella TaxID=2685620 RepID=UPI00080E7223|nr:glycosyltransferase [Gilliamella apicola]OCG63005.1 glycosyl transferase family 8 [Gilliamella apicola]OCG76817.1 glycosyl transferase family 8 [Gilliamella apicola]
MKNEVINVAFCTDGNYLEYVAIAIKSIQLNNLGNHLQFHVFLYDVPKEAVHKLQQLNVSIKSYFIENNELDKYQTEHQLQHINRSMYIRLLVPRLLKNEVDKFIYLDADILCFRDISSINQIDIDSVVCAVVSDSLISKNIEKNITRLELSSDNYFNSGFLYINTKNWCDSDIENKVNSVLLNPQQYRLVYPDQDALNLILQNKVKYVDCRWNYLFTWMTETEKNKIFDNEDILPFFIHFTGARKPWYQEHEGTAQNLYVFYKHFTPWANKPLESYLPRMRVNDYRIYAKSFFRKGDFYKGIKFFIQYLLLKYRKKK